jgi:hypothetical protein
MTYLLNDHVNAVLAEHMREAEHARFVREVKQANKANKEPKPRRRRRFFRLRDPLRA